LASGPFFIDPCFKRDAIEIAGILRLLLRRFAWTDFPLPGGPIRMTIWAGRICASAKPIVRRKIDVDAQMREGMITALRVPSSYDIQLASAVFTMEMRNDGQPDDDEENVHCTRGCRMQSESFNFFALTDVDDPVFPLFISGPPVASFLRVFW